MQDVLTLLTDYWQMLEPNRPHLVISVIGGAKNFKLDPKKEEVFATGLIKVSLHNLRYNNLKVFKLLKLIKLNWRFFLRIFCSNEGLF